jgi:hypothetical protein
MFSFSRSTSARTAFLKSSTCQRIITINEPARADWRLIKSPMTVLRRTEDG